jgi:hypothetical protein
MDKLCGERKPSLPTGSLATPGPRHHGCAPTGTHQPQTIGRDTNNGRTVMVSGSTHTRQPGGRRLAHQPDTGGLPVEVALSRPAGGAVGGLSDARAVPLTSMTPDDGGIQQPRMAVVHEGSPTKPRGSNSSGGGQVPVDCLWTDPNRPSIFRAPTSRVAREPKGLRSRVRRFECCRGHSPSHLRSLVSGQGGCRHEEGGSQSH